MRRTNRPLQHHEAALPLAQMLPLAGAFVLAVVRLLIKRKDRIQ